MNKNDLMMKAVIDLKGGVGRYCGGLLCATKKNRMQPEGFVYQTLASNESEFFEVNEDTGSRSWLCTRKEFEDFVDDLVDSCIKWDAPKWSGEGVPPVGTECEYISQGGSVDVAICYVGRKFVVFKNKHGREFSRRIAGSSFRPLKTDAEKERESLIHILCGEDGANIETTKLDEHGWGELADRVIAAGWRPTELECDTSQNGESNV